MVGSSKQETMGLSPTACRADFHGKRKKVQFGTLCTETRAPVSATKGLCGRCGRKRARVGGAVLRVSATSEAASHEHSKTCHYCCCCCRLHHNVYIFLPLFRLFSFDIRAETQTSFSHFQGKHRSRETGSTKLLRSLRQYQGPLVSGSIARVPLPNPFLGPGHLSQSGPPRSAFFAFFVQYMSRTGCCPGPGFASANKPH
ncbi:hypothetical protein B0T19DRAFT_45858 [Cercophora scortea]|uniref:Uncharacterized protein n=1 Tax=Cercophora scortea TaxID=314031 RepID=A0AAE0J5M6_9PEZI|nr:hypothetical protein B0T19DRAFT_45858 [Cercophora scortea]